MSNNLKNIEINGPQLHYVEQGEDGQQPTIVFIHGGLDDYRC
jgi:pimeloyl-ACP methyl ester carboxylesterase